MSYRLILERTGGYKPVVFLCNTLVQSNMLADTLSVTDADFKSVCVFDNRTNKCVRRSVKEMTE